VDSVPHAFFLNNFRKTGFCLKFFGEGAIMAKYERRNGGTYHG
jgi:hypothetical protein